NVEDAQTARSDVDRGIKTIIAALHLELRLSHRNILDKFPDYPKYLNIIPSDQLLNTILSEFSMNLEKPLILFIDEIDSLVGDTLISVLRQLRSGYINRPRGFPQTVILCGVRDLQDYRIHSEREQAIITGGRAFNIKVKSIRLGNFTKDEIQRLYLEHTKETGQEFEEEVFEYAWELTEGQPWLVNALAYESCFELEKNRNNRITREMIEQAKENIILRRDKHIDILIDKLSEPRVRRVIEPILYSEDETIEMNPNDISYVEDLGLIKLKNGKYVISNAIYREVIPRELIYTKQGTLDIEPLQYIKDIKIQIDKLMIRFQEFYRENSEVWLERFAYKEAGPYLLLMAFLQRVINGGGTIHREYGLGRRRIDLLVKFNKQKICI
ncbi:MAG TPA: AAA-like domain-containing protein, partial [bacterium]|nr:AAA-like domain-containing protein [bacterium]